MSHAILIMANKYIHIQTNKPTNQPTNQICIHHDSIVPMVQICTDFNNNNNNNNKHLI